MTVIPARLSKAGPRSLVVHSVLAAILCQAYVAEARPARCSTSDEGHFKCEFRATARDGSFQISAQGKPTYTLNMVEPGFAYGFLNLSKGNIPLPGRFVRNPTEKACWENDATSTRICAW
ncbi:hypothetical protein [Accumulibacter sp.]|uniref:hypothetical protein n=1 Tax=Accumulibacter sp. TaxID=2053492 RepID=UPI003DA8C78F